MTNFTKHMRGVLLILLTILITKCVSIIEFDGTNDERQLVIYGKLTNSQPYDQAITVQWSDLNTTAGLSVTSATVVVEDDNDQVYPYAYSFEEKKYLPVTPLVGVPGTAYRARVTMNDETYLSSFQRMPTAGAQDSSYFEFDRVPVISDIGVEFQRYILKVFTDSKLDPSEDPIFMKWDIEQVYIQQEMSLPASSFPFYSPRNCYVYDEYLSPEVLLFDGDLVNTTTIEKQQTAEVPLDNSFQRLRGYGVIQSSFSREALEYWQRVNDVSNRVGSIFEIPPAPIPGNFSSVLDPDVKALGFFEVAKMDTSGTFVTEGDLPVRLGFGGDLVDCTNFVPGQFDNVPPNCFPCLAARGVPEACYNCLVVPNSSLVRPSYLP